MQKQDDTAVVGEVRLIHDWGHVVQKPVLILDETDHDDPEGRPTKSVYVVWGLSNCKVSVYSGRLLGSTRRRLWRLHRDDLRKVRKLAGWRPRTERCKLGA